MVNSSVKLTLEYIALEYNIYSQSTGSVDQGGYRAVILECGPTNCPYRDRMFTFTRQLPLYVQFPSLFALSNDSRCALIFLWSRLPIKRYTVYGVRVGLFPKY